MFYVNKVIIVIIIINTHPYCFSSGQAKHQFAKKAAYYNTLRGDRLSESLLFWKRERYFPADDMGREVAFNRDCLSLQVPGRQPV